LKQDRVVKVPKSKRKRLRKKLGGVSFIAHPKEGEFTQEEVDSFLAEVEAEEGQLPFEVIAPVGFVNEWMGFKWVRK
jgi:hypothetical protein